MANQREELKQLLLVEIEKSQAKGQRLIVEKVGSGAGTSWSSIEHLLVEQRMAVNEGLAGRCEQALWFLETPKGASIVTIRRGDDGEEERYVVVDADWAFLEVGDYYIVSRASPVGQAIWEKGIGSARMKTPDGFVEIEILEVA